MNEEQSQTTTGSKQPTPVSHNGGDGALPQSQQTEQFLFDSGPADGNNVPPPAPPANAAQMPPMDPNFNVIVRCMGKVSAKKLREEDATRTMEVLFGTVLSTTAKDNEGKETPLHRMIDGRTETKHAWIDFATDMFYDNKNGSIGPLAMYEPNDGKEWQNKLKQVVLENAEYFHNVSAPSLEEKLSAADDEGLSMLGQPPESPMFHSKKQNSKKQNDTTSPVLSSSSSLEDSDSSKSSSESDEGSNKVDGGRNVRGRLPEERENARRAASNAAKVKADAKQGKVKRGPKNREAPTHKDYVDMADKLTDRAAKEQVCTEELMAMSRQVMRTILDQHALQETTRTNTPKSSPHTKRTKIRKEISDEQAIIRNLYEELKMMEDNKESEKAINQQKERIAAHHEQTIKLDMELAKEIEKK